MGNILQPLIAKRISLPALALLLLGWSAAACAAETPVPMPLSAIAEMGSAACQRPLVSFEGVVTHARPTPGDFFVQQDHSGLFVENPTQIQVDAGDRVRVEGSVNCGLHPSIHASAIRKLGRGTLPAAVPVTFTELMKGKYDAVLVRVHGIVRSADPGTQGGIMPHGATLRMMANDGPIDVVLHHHSASSLEQLFDAEVEVTGIAGVRQDDKLQRVGAVLYAGSMDNVRVLQRTTTDPWNLPPTPMDSVMEAYSVRSLSHRVRVHGSVTLVEPGQAVVLQDGQQSLQINTESSIPLKIGDEVDAIGFPVLSDNFITLSRAELRATGRQRPATPVLANWQSLYSGRHAYDLVTLDGVVLQEMRGTREDSYILAADGNLFGAILRHPQPSASGLTWPRTEERMLPIGAHVRLTGVCFPIVGYNRTSGDLPFNILLRSDADVAILSGPSVITTRNLATLTVVLLLVLVVLSVRFWRTERRVRRDMARLAYSERRRSRILEQINGSVPLAEIIEQTAELVSFRLQGAPCWVHIEGGADLGNLPKHITEFRIVEMPIPARSGHSAGTIYAAIDSLHSPAALEKEALSMAAGLIELAMETRKTYTDLIRRSEFDQLTNVQNRFSLERSLDQQIRHARASAGIFGLIYIDLNGFKQVNDMYGHQVGDCFLQEIALRMKRQLRPGDLLARLGGDEFAVLVPEIRSRAEVEEISLRLEHCFDDPFQVSDCSIQGSAAIGLALYPEDGRTREALLSAADAAMYVVKHTQGNQDSASAQNAGAA